MNTKAQINAPVVDLLRAPDGPRDRQVLYGDHVTILATKDGWSQIEVEKDGYIGFVPDQCLAPAVPPTHWISAPSTHAYTAPDLKSPDVMALSFGCRITALGQAGGHIQITDGFVPIQHVSPIDTLMTDPLEVAQMFLGVPYLWGGNSRFGIDCSGLVQAAYLACGRSCPGDSSQQQQHDPLGDVMPPDTAPQRNDLLFFKGHVSMVYDADTILHANAHHMAVSFEPLRPALARIKAQGDGRVVCHRRP